MTTAAVKKLQRQLNYFAAKYLAGYQPIRVDGQMGKSTRGRIITAKRYLGYEGKLNADVTEGFLSRLYHPKSLRYSSPQRLFRAAQRRIEQRKKWKANHRSAVRTTGVGKYDGVPVANVAIPYLQWARANGWRGTLVSGWRDPEYSKSLCLRMCGRPSCPGRCAGLASNHVGSTSSRFAMDVSDYTNFGRIIARCPLSPKIFNALGARDPVHFSPSGN